MIKPNNYRGDEDVTKTAEVLTRPELMAPVAVCSGAAFIRQIVVTQASV
jgi:hypothetical protein